MNQKKMVCAVLVNDFGDIIPHTCRPYKSMCEEYCEEFFPAWEQMKKIGCKVVQAEIILLEN